MADNVAITPGSGAKAASREVSYSGETAQMQVVALATVAGADDAKTVTDVSETSPMPVAGYGELIETLEAIRMAMQSLTRAAGLLTVDTGGRVRMLLDSISASLTLAAITTVSTVTTVTTVSTVTNQSQMGGFAAQDQIPALMHLQADNLRRNISVT
jgi:hypothetical protein